MLRATGSRRRILSGVVMLITLPIIAAGDAAAAGPESDVAGTGQLLHRVDGEWVALPLLELRCELEIHATSVRGRVLQRFRNPGATTVEASYVFPLPAGAAVDRMRIRIGTRSIVAEVQERDRARATYDDARERGRKAALVQRRAGNLFTTAVANVNPGETVAVELEYLDQARWEGGVFEARLPLRFTARARETGDPGVAPGPAESAALPRARLQVRLAPGFAILPPTSPSHELLAVREETGWRLESKGDGIVADRDLVLRWRPEPGAGAAVSLVSERHADATYAQLTLLPAPDGAVGAGLPTETLFVVDVSGSMRGVSIRQAREALLAALDRLRPDDRVNMLAFNDRSRAFETGFVNADDDARERARRWVAGLVAGGGTEIHAALLHAYTLLGESRSRHAQRIVFLTDGAVGNEQRLLRTVSERGGQTRLHTLGIGHAPNGYLMRRLAHLGRGLCAFVNAGEDTDNAIDRFFSRVERPLIRDLELHGVAAEVAASVHPRSIPDLHAGEPLVLTLRLPEGGSAAGLTLTGSSQRGAWRHAPGPAVEVPPGSGIATRWARDRIAALEAMQLEGADPGFVRGEIVELALRFRLLTRHTSLVAVDSEVTAMTPALSLQARGVLPQGGTDAPRRRLLGLALLVTGLALAALVIVRRGG